MKLEKLYLPTRANQLWEHNGIDSRAHCLDRNLFDSYKHKVVYQHNSRGFRDDEWPDDLSELSQSIWCLGDSFTLGLGCPIEHTWPYLLQRALGKRTINVSMDGASNDWISRHARNILKHLRPDIMIIMWTFLHRREDPDDSLCDEDRRRFLDADLYRLVDSNDRWKQDIINFQSCVESLKDHKDTRLLQFIVPGAVVDKDQHNDRDWNADILNRLLQKHSINAVEQIDMSRDGYHFDIMTAQTVVDKITWDLGL